eukprot:TRINITY_DN23645_c0_g1_i2.p1 TRINITY_DN23645_c0_g1~~TRINITY_DN23645_c0_g1_i2.p1  ORF type:complete len:249 (+),score=30.56 TRINITY_DN23645_c0_g1_i2:75-749(+)
MESMRKHAASMKKLRQRADRLRTLLEERQVNAGSDSSFERSSESFDSVDSDERRLAWPQPARLPTEREYAKMTIEADDGITEHVPAAEGDAPGPGAFFSKCDSSRSSVDDDYGWKTEKGIEASSVCNGPLFKTPMPRSVTIRDLPDWRACMLPVPSYSPYEEDEKPLNSNASSVRLMFGHCRARQSWSSISSSSSGSSSSDVWTYEIECPRSRTLIMLPEHRNS